MPHLIDRQKCLTGWTNGHAWFDELTDMPYLIPTMLFPSNIHQSGKLMRLFFTFTFILMILMIMMVMTMMMMIKIVMMMMMIMMMMTMMMVMMMMSMVVMMANWQSRHRPRHKLTLKHSSFWIGAASILPKYHWLWYTLGLLSVQNYLVCEEETNSVRVDFWFWGGEGVFPPLQPLPSISLFCQLLLSFIPNFFGDIVQSGTVCVQWLVKYTLVTTRKEVGIGDHGLGAEEENGLRTGLRPDRSGLVARGCWKKELAWPPGLEVENGHRKVDGWDKDKKDDPKRPDRSAGVRSASDFGLSAVRRKDGHGHRKVIHWDKRDQ